MRRSYQPRGRYWSLSVGWLIPLSPPCYAVLGRDRRDGAMTDFPRSLPAFERRFPDEAACAEWLLERRWGSGFACPACGHGEGWRLGRKVLTLQCKACRRETSVTAGTVMHRSHLPLKVWFTAAWLVATHRNGMSARQLWLQLGLGSYKSAWLLLRKLRAAMVDPDRGPLAVLVEVDETSLPFRAKGEPVRPRRSPASSASRSRSDHIPTTPSSHRAQRYKPYFCIARRRSAKGPRAARARSRPGLNGSSRQKLAAGHALPLIGIGRGPNPRFR